MTSKGRATNKVARYRQRMRAAGLRLVQFWVPETRTPEFATEIKNQCRNLKGNAAEIDVLHFTEMAATHVEGWK